MIYYKHEFHTTLFLVRHFAFVVQSLEGLNFVPGGRSTVKAMNDYQTKTPPIRMLKATFSTCLCTLF